MPRNQSIVQRNKNNKITSTEVPHPWEKLVTYKSNGDISEEYYMNPHTNATATTVREVISINFHEQGKKNAEKEVAKLMQTPEYQLHNHKTWDEINQMVVEERLDDTYLSTKKLVPENPVPDRRSLIAEAAGRSLRETAINESEWLVEDLVDIGDRDQQVVPRITHLVDRLVDLLRFLRPKRHRVLVFTQLPSHKRSKRHNQRSRQENDSSMLPTKRICTHLEDVLFLSSCNGAFDVATSEQSKQSFGLAELVLLHDNAFG